MVILVSSCLAGMKVRYNGSDSLHDTIASWIQQGVAIPVCPELLGGFSTPREPAEIIGGTGEDVIAGTARVVSKSGQDVTEMYMDGAKQVLEMTQNLGITMVVLKEYSPSCGSQMIYDGTFGNHKIAGEGVTTALLRQAGIKVISESQLENTSE
ncbi:hypothetical protein D3C77_410150 [compost metagenome]